MLIIEIGKYYVEDARIISNINFQNIGNTSFGDIC